MPAFNVGSTHPYFSQVVVAAGPRDRPRVFTAAEVFGRQSGSGVGRRSADGGGREGLISDITRKPNGQRNNHFREGK